ncbi:deleted in malignant brain tumors 1 protein-like [Megalops cyprinoides]|uniref:deleted in malignant brain tumors 1 protein-like n=1 Tax=Megalops cyprinoides TaxID=118141 RepID=UPI001864446A|nr:deleted in malignant brain tumors 1 protein-like [Megalops cyprinoides]
MPYGEVSITIDAQSSLERVTEIAVVGPPGLWMSALTGDQSAGSSASISIVWVRSPNNLPHLLPICFTANTNSLQSDFRCVWIEQKTMDPLPPGTVLECGQKEMNLVLPLSSLHDLPLSDLQLNDASCPILNNDTHLMAQISLTGCGTKIVHSGWELVYTNTLRSVRPPSTISRFPSLVLPLACRLPALQRQAPAYSISVPIEEEAFGAVHFWLEFHRPGQGPLGNQTRFMSTQVKEATLGVQSASHLEMLDLHVFSDCQLERAELMVGTCMKSETPDFQVAHPILQNGCVSDNTTLELLIQNSMVKVFRINLPALGNSGSTMYVECKVHLCVTMKPSQKCPDECGGSMDRLMLQKTTVLWSWVWPWGSFTCFCGPSSINYIIRPSYGHSPSSCLTNKSVYPTQREKDVERPPHLTNQMSVI